MARQKTGKDVIAAARTIADREGNALAPIEFFNRLSMQLRPCRCGGGKNDNGQSFEHIVLLVRLAMIRDLQTMNGACTIEVRADVAKYCAYKYGAYKCGA